MIDIILIRSKECDEFNFSGHAKYNKKGKDIVCASVSSLVEYLGFAASNMNNAIGKPQEPEIEDGASIITFNNPDISIVDGTANIKTSGDIHNYSYYVSKSVVVTSAIDMLGRLSKQYPNNVCFKIYVKKENIEPDTKDIA